MRCRILGRAFLLLALGGALAFRGDLGAQGQLRRYLIQLRGEPVGRELLRSRPARGREINPGGAEAISYRSRILARQGALRRRIEARPYARVRAQMDTVFNGMAVELREEDVERVRQDPEVEEVFPSTRYHKLLDATLPLVDVPAAWNNPKIGGEANAGAGIRIAVIDTGIDVNHPMFQDPSLTLPPGFPHSTASTPECPNNDQRFTNSKVIVARNYVSLLDEPEPNCDALDRDGHGTFAAAIAAGRRVTAPLASIAGVAPKAYLGSYKVFGNGDATTSEAMVKAFDDAVKDGMQVINLSAGALTPLLPSREPLAVTAATAVDLGVTVVVASGNDGPGTGTVNSPGISPAVITVGATTNARLFGNPLTITASVPVPSELSAIRAVMGNGPAIASTVGPAPLLDVQSLDGTGTACGDLPAGSLQGRIALIRRGDCNFSAKIHNAFRAGAIAAILYNHLPGQPPVLFTVEDAREIPSAMIGNHEGLVLKQFLASAGTGALASLGAEQKAITVPPNRMTDFSSAGPSTDFGIKPDLVAPGADIYSAAQRNDPSGIGFNASGFVFDQGTSFSAPFVAGAAALVKQASPGFTPAQIKSALVNTAAKIVTDPNGRGTSVLAQGNGLLDVAAALSTPATVSPVSVSFGARTPGSLLNSTTNLTVTNVGSSTDTFNASVTVVPGKVRVTFSVSPASFPLEAGATQSLTFSASSSEPLNETVEGFLTIQSQNTQRSITVPYWGTFLRPAVNTGGVVNAASFSAGPLTVAAGSLVTIFGTQLVERTAEAVTLPLPRSLSGVRVTLDGSALPLLLASPAQINAQLPTSLSSARTSATLVVQLNGVTSTATTVLLSPAAPGIFTVGPNDLGRGVIVHSPDFSLVTRERPARAGEILSVFATGLGATSPSVPTGSPAPSAPLSVTRISPTATIGGIAAPVRFSGLTPAFVGLYQVNVEIPAGVPAGDQTLLLNSDGTASNPVTVAIAP